MGHIQTLDELIAFLFRRRWLILAVTVLGALTAAVYAKSRPDTYESAAVIQVELPTVSAEQDSATETGTGAAQFLQSIEQRLTTRENLTAMIERHGLYTDLAALPMDRKLALLRSSVTFQGVESSVRGASGAGLSAILIVARMETGDLAARVANDFAQEILDQSAAGARDRAQESVAFFREEEDQIWSQIAALEREIADYKNAHAAALPAQAQAMRDERTALDEDLRRIAQDRIAAARDRDTLAAGADTLRETDRRRLAELDSRLQVLDAQDTAARARRAELDAALAATPEVERVLSGYDRQLGQLQDQYEVASQRLAEAATELKLAERQQSERLSLLERAIAPQDPVGGGGKKIALTGALGSLLAGIGLAFLIEMLRPVIRSPAQMARELDLRPVVSIPELRPARRGGGQLMRLIDDPTRPLLGLPRFAVVAAAAVVALLAAAALVA